MINSKNDVVRFLKDSANQVNSEIILYLIKENETEKNRIASRILRYDGKADGFDDTGRVTTEKNKVNYIVRFPFWNKIIYEKTGYLANDLNIDLNKESDKYINNETLYEDHKKIIMEYIENTELHDKNIQLKENVAILGNYYRYLYINDKLEIATQNMTGEEVIFIYDTSGLKLNFVLRYYLIADSISGNFYRVEWFTDKEIFFFEQSKFSELKLIKRQPHGFDYVPIFECKNNYKKMGDCELMITGRTFDMYDYTYSDLLSELAQFRLTYLFTKNIQLTKKQADEARQAGIFGFTGKDVDMKWLIKNFDTKPVMDVLNKVEKLLYSLSNSADINDENFGQLSGVAAQYKLFYLDMKSKQFLKHLIQFEKEEFKTYFSHLKKMRIADIDYKDLLFNFQFNRVINYKEEAETAVIEKQTLDQKTILRGMSKVDDPDMVIDARKTDLEEMMSFVDENTENVDVLTPENLNIE